MPDVTTTQQLSLDGLYPEVLGAAFPFHVQFLEDLVTDEVPCRTGVYEGLG